MQLINLVKKYESKTSSQLIFDNTSFTFPDTTSIALRGRSGSGKTTLLAILAGLDIEYEGSYISNDTVLQKDIKKTAEYRMQKIAMIKQNFVLLNDRNIYDNLAFPLQCMKIEKQEIHKRIIEILQLFKLENLAEKFPKALSGGEKQRIVIARALIQGSEYIFADEPTSELDEESEDFILQIFATYQKKGVKFIIATHSEKVSNFCKSEYLIQHHKLKLIREC